MRLLTFFVYAVLAALAFAAALLPRPLPAPRPLDGADSGPAEAPARRRLAFGLACAALAALTAKALFALLPGFEARVMPVAGYADIQRDFYLPFAVLFFALASRLVERRRRLLVVAAAGFMALVTVQQVFWRLSRPVAYDFAGRIDEDGVCLQSSGYTCAAASMATLLRVHGIEAAEGEMAELSGTIPGRGASYFQAAGGLRKKLRRMGRSERPILRVPGRRGLEAIPCPFLAGVGHGFLFDHMVCVLGVGPGSVRIGDPLRGARTMDRREFEDRWQGIAVVLER